jgi:hypothetical protein
MHFHLPKPLHGWRAFAGEVGIIVIGVLIALGAEQTLQSFHWRGEVRQFRVAVDQELAYDLAALQYRLRQEVCVRRRIASLESWRDSARAGAPIRRISEVGRPSHYSFARSVWDSRRGDLMGQMPLAATVGYSTLYDQFDNVSAQVKDEKDAWRAMAEYNGSTVLSEEDIKHVTALIYSAKSIDGVLSADWKQMSRQAAQMGIRPDFGQEAAFITPADPQFCQPLLVSAK